MIYHQISCWCRRCVHKSLLQFGIKRYFWYPLEVMDAVCFMSKKLDCITFDPNSLTCIEIINIVVSDFWYGNNLFQYRSNFDFVPQVKHINSRLLLREYAHWNIQTLYNKTMNILYQMILLEIAREILLGIS